MASRSGAPDIRAGSPIIFPIAAVILFLAWYLGRNPSLPYVIAPLAVAAGMALLRQPRLGLLSLIFVALAVPISIPTGTEVQLNLAALAAPALFGIWLLGGALRGRITVPTAPVNLPLLLFLLAGLLSLGIGIATWDPLIPRRPSFVVVQLAQWVVFAFSAMAFWLTAILVRDVRWLQRMTVTFLLLGGLLALLRVVPLSRPTFLQITTGAVDRAPFWLLLSALAGGQLLFNSDLRLRQQLALVTVLGLVLYYALFLEREGASTWIGVATVCSALVWLRFSRVRWLLTAMLLTLIVVGAAIPALWEFAGGDAEWAGSGVPRLVLIERVVDVTMRNPITGLGPAAYRQYASHYPLELPGGYLWLGSVISSHNNFVDLFSHMGIIGLSMFGWFVVEYGRLANRMRQRIQNPFARGYVNSMLAAGLASLVIMLLADWMLPFVYNIGFHGFQASVLVWTFLGGMLSLDTLQNDWNG